MYGYGYYKEQGFMDSCNLTDTITYCNFLDAINLYYMKTPTVTDIVEIPIPNSDAK